MDEYYFNFSEKLGEQLGFPTTVVGNPRIELDPETNLSSCFFDGDSAIEINNLDFGSKNFTIEFFFRSLETTKEQGIFGSTGYKLAYRSDRGSQSYSFWANFPSSVAPKTIQNNAYPNNMTSEHYIVITRKGNIYKLYDNCVLIGSLDYAHSYWRMPIYLGYYYDLIYGFHGYIREFKISMNRVLKVSNSVPLTLMGQNTYEIG